MSSVSSVLRDRFFRGCEGEGEGERGERGERGKRGHRGHRGHRGERGERGHDGRDGETGPTGPTGPFGLTGATGPAGTGSTILHVEDKSDAQTLLPPDVTTTVLTTPPITAPVGSIVEITAMVQYRNLNNTQGSTLVFVELDQDGNFVVNTNAVAPGIPGGGGTFELNVSIPLVWYLAGDGLPHVYTVSMATSIGTTGTQLARTRAIFVNVIGP